MNMKVLIYKIPAADSMERKGSSAILDFTLAIARMSKSNDCCLFSLHELNILPTSFSSLKEAYLIIPEDKLEYFSPLLLKYNALTLDKLPKAGKVNVIYGDGAVISQCE